MKIKLFDIDKALEMSKRHDPNDKSGNLYGLPEDVFGGILSAYGWGWGDAYKTACFNTQDWYVPWYFVESIVEY